MRGDAAKDSHHRRIRRSGHSPCQVHSGQATAQGQIQSSGQMQYIVSEFGRLRADLGVYRDDCTLGIAH
jgi:hypothetical protein